MYFDICIYSAHNSLIQCTILNNFQNNDESYLAWRYWKIGFKARKQFAANHHLMGARGLVRKMCRGNIQVLLLSFDRKLSVEVIVLRMSQDYLNEPKSKAHINF